MTHELSELNEKDITNGDYIITPLGRGELGFEVNTEGGFRRVGEFANEAHVVAAIRTNMELNQYWPRVWYSTAYDNAHLVILRQSWWRHVL
jgi:hypothetical protein